MVDRICREMVVTNYTVYEFVGLSGDYFDNKLIYLFLDEQS